MRHPFEVVRERHVVQYATFPSLGREGTDTNHQEQVPSSTSSFGRIGERASETSTSSAARVSSPLYLVGLQTNSVRVPLAVVGSTGRLPWASFPTLDATSEVTSCASSSQPSTSYYTPRHTDDRIFSPQPSLTRAPESSPRPRRLPQIQPSTSPPSQSSVKLSFEATPRSRLVSPRPLPAPPVHLMGTAVHLSPGATFDVTSQIGPPSYLASKNGSLTNISVARANSPDFRHQTLVYRPPPLSPNRPPPLSVNWPPDGSVTSSHGAPSGTNVSLSSPTIRLYHPTATVATAALDRSRRGQFEVSEAASAIVGGEPVWPQRPVATDPAFLPCFTPRVTPPKRVKILPDLSPSDNMFTRKKRSRPIVESGPIPSPNTQSLSASSCCVPARVGQSCEEGASELSPRHMLDDTHSSEMGSLQSSRTVQSPWPCRDDPPLSNKGKSVPRLPLRELVQWRRNTSVKPLSLTRSGAVPYTTRDTTFPFQAPTSRYAPPTVSQQPFSSRVHLQTAGGRQELLLKPIPHKRLIAAAEKVSTAPNNLHYREGTPRKSLTSSSKPTSCLPPSAARENLSRTSRHRGEPAHRAPPLSARPTLESTASRNSLLFSVGAPTGRVGLPTDSRASRPVTCDPWRHLDYEYEHIPHSTSTITDLPKTYRSVAHRDSQPHIEPSSSISQTSTANESHSSYYKLDSRKISPEEDKRVAAKKSTAVGSAYGFTPFTTREGHLKLTLSAKQPLRSCLQETPSLTSFETIAMIGQGGYAVVRVVRHKISNQVFALKQVAKADFSNVAQLRMAFTEIDILWTQERLSRKYAVSQSGRSGCSKALSQQEAPVSDGERRKAITDYVRARGHEFFPRFYHCWQDEYFIFFLMEYLPGGDLMKHLIDREIFPESVARFYAAQIAVATGFMHDHLLYVHRDIKPDNVLFDASGHTKLVDFGLSRVIRPRLGTSRDPKFTELFHSAVGTPDYMAPEVHRPGVPHDRTIDWWSLGIILYEMLFGGPPLSDLQHRPEVTSQLIRNWKSFLTSWPKSPPVSSLAKDLLSKLIAEKGDRLKTVEDVLSHPWFKDLNLEDIRMIKAPIIPKILGPTDVRNFDTFTPSKLLQWEEKKMRSALHPDVAAILLESRKGSSATFPCAGEPSPHIPFVTSQNHFGVHQHLLQSANGREMMSSQMLVNYPPPANVATSRRQHGGQRHQGETRTRALPVQLHSLRQHQAEAQQRRMEPSSSANHSMLLQRLTCSGRYASKQARGVTKRWQYEKVENHNVTLPFMASQRNESPTLLSLTEDNNIPSPNAASLRMMHMHNKEVDVTPKRLQPAQCDGADATHEFSRSDEYGVILGENRQSNIFTGLKTAVTLWLTSSSSSSSASSATQTDARPIALGSGQAEANQHPKKLAASLTSSAIKTHNRSTNMDLKLTKRGVDKKDVAVTSSIS